MKEGPTALNIESSQNDDGELAYFADAQALYHDEFAYSKAANIFFLPSFIKYARITNIYARFTVKFISPLSQNILREELFLTKTHILETTQNL